MTEIFVVMVTGSREYTDRKRVKFELDQLLMYPNLLVLVGDCPTGADLYAREWVEARVHEGGRVGCRVFYAFWERYGKRAGPERNERMVNDRPQLVLAFYQPDAGNVGTANAVKLARAAGIRVVEYGKENQETPEHRQETLPI